MELGIWQSSHSVLSSTALPSIPSDRAAVLSRVTRRLIPFVFLCYVVAYIDRVNIGFAASASCSATSA